MPCRSFGGVKSQQAQLLPLCVAASPQIFNGLFNLLLSRTKCLVCGTSDRGTAAVPPAWNILLLLCMTVRLASLSLRLWWHFSEFEHSQRLECYAAVLFWRNNQMCHNMKSAVKMPHLFWLCENSAWSTVALWATRQMIVVTEVAVISLYFSITA